MSTMKVTLIGLYQYLQDDLFKNLVLPEGIVKADLVNNILLRGGEFEALYGDPIFMQDAIGLWGRKWYRTFEKWVQALSLEYNPLENYDRKEDFTDTLDKGVSTDSITNSNLTRTFNNTDTNTPGTTTTTTHDVSAYDSSTYQSADKDTTSLSGYDTLAHTGTVTDASGIGTKGNEKENSKSIHDGRIHGNVGVTTSQQMLESELRISEWNLYEHITDLFLSEFVIPIYS